MSYTISLRTAPRPHSAPALPALTAADKAALKRAAQAVLAHCHTPAPAALTLLLSDDAELARLNAAYLGIDSPTDVLSFPAGDPDPETGAAYLGDVVISLARAQAQAAAGGHPLLEELRLLVVHGALHLLGYDHADPAGRARMWAVQAEVLAHLGSALRAPR
jgi:probable rRNA maturation factor